MQIEMPELLRRQPAADDQPWLLSFSDLVTLLLAFFVLFFAISQVDQSKFEMIMEYFSESRQMPLHQLEENLQQLIAEYQLQESVDVELTKDGLLLNFQDKILFASGRAELKEEAGPVLDAIAAIFRTPEVADRSIQVEGHTDTLPLSKNAIYPSNWELSTARSARVIRYLIDHGLVPQRFVAVGFADTRLREPEDETRRGLPVNRRVSLLVK